MAAGAKAPSLGEAQLYRNPLTQSRPSHIPRDEPGVLVLNVISPRCWFGSPCRVKSQSRHCGRYRADPFTKKRESMGQPFRRLCDHKEFHSLRSGIEPCASIRTRLIIANAKAAHPTRTVVRHVLEIGYLPLVMIRRSGSRLTNLRPSAIRLNRGVHTQHLHELCDLAQMPQRIACRFVVAAQEVDVEHIFPRSSAHGP